MGTNTPIGTTSYPVNRIDLGCEFVSGYAFKGKDFTDFGYPIIKIKNIQNRNVTTQGSQCVPPDVVDDKLEKFRLYDGDVLIAMTGQGSVGRVGRLHISKGEIPYLNQRVGKFVVDEIHLNLDYLYYLLSSRPYENHLFSAGSGSGQPNLSPSTILSTEIPLPRISIQRTIAHILGSLDDKIELNRRMNETLEQMAAAIFKAWFVDFELVKAKAGGAKRFPSMPQEVFDSLPTEFTDSPLGPIPKEWSVSTINDQCSLVMGQSPKSEFYNEQGDGLPFHQGVRAFGERFPTHDTYCTVENRLAESGDILFSVRAPVGRINIADRKLIVGRGLAAIRHRNDTQSFLLYSLKHQFHVEDSIGTGTIFASVTKKDMENIHVLNPSIECLQAFEEIAGSFDQRYAVNVKESATLASIRDLLLPKLLSGEIRVGEAEKIVEEVA